MACGLCVVSTDAGGVPDLVDNEREALVVPRADSEAMAAAARRILSDSNLAATLSANGRRKAESFGWDVILPEWEELLVKVAGSKG
jgi:glycosyltransferase involved in cell wall biosynthesis